MARLRDPPAEAVGFPRMKRCYKDHSFTQDSQRCLDCVDGTTWVCMRRDKTLNIEWKLKGALNKRTTGAHLRSWANYPSDVCLGGRFFEFLFCGGETMCTRVHSVS